MLKGKEGNRHSRIEKERVDRDKEKEKEQEKEKMEFGASAENLRDSGSCHTLQPLSATAVKYMNCIANSFCFGSPLSLSRVRRFLVQPGKSKPSSSPEISFDSSSVSSPVSSSTYPDVREKSSKKGRSPRHGQESRAERKWGGVPDPLTLTHFHKSVLEPIPVPKHTPKEEFFDVTLTELKHSRDGGSAENYTDSPQSVLDYSYNYSIHAARGDVGVVAQVNSPLFSIDVTALEGDATAAEPIGKSKQRRRAGAMVDSTQDLFLSRKDASSLSNSADKKEKKNKKKGSSIKKFPRSTSPGKASRCGPTKGSRIVSSKQLSVSANSMSTVRKKVELPPREPRRGSPLPTRMGAEDRASAEEEDKDVLLRQKGLKWSVGAPTLYSVPIPLLDEKNPRVEEANKYYLLSIDADRKVNPSPLQPQPAAPSRLTIHCLSSYLSSRIP